jgi:hypothetical protein
MASDPHDPAARLRVLCWAAFGWIVAFIVLHLHWFAGGRILRGGQEQMYPVPETSGDYVFAVVVSAMFAVGTVLPLAMFQRWGRRLPGWLLLAAAWFACAILVLRAVAGLLDSALRETGIARNGLTGLTYEQVTGIADPSAYTKWSGVGIDVIFLTGGVLFGLSALAFRRIRVRSARQP